MIQLSSVGEYERGIGVPLEESVELGWRQAWIGCVSGAKEREME